MSSNNPASQHPTGQTQSTPTSDGLLAAIEKITRELDALRGIGAEQHQRATEVLSREAEIAAHSGRVSELEQRLRAREGELTQLAERLAVANNQLAERESAVKSTEEELVARRAKLDEVESHAASAQRLLDTAEQELSDASERLVERSREVSAREQAAEERSRAIQDREKELAQKARSENEEAARRIAELERSIESLRAESREAETLKARLAASEARAATIEGKLKDSDDRHAGASGRAAEIESKAQQLTARLAESEARVAQLDAARAEAERAAAAAEQSAKAQSGGNQHEMAKRERAIEMLRERLSMTEARCRSLEGEVEAAQQLMEQAGTARPRTDEFLASRRARLQRQRELLEERARKIIRAKDALAQRAAECEAILSQRSAAAEEMAAIADHQRVAHPGSPKRSAGVLVACGMTTLASALLAAWPIAGLFAEPVYLAHARMGMEKAGGEPGRAQIDSWTGFHQALVADPQFLEQAADKLKRRGYTEVGSAAALKSRLDRDLQVEPAAEGEMGLSLRGEGSARTQGILEVFSGALAGAANDTRERRADRATTFMIVRATSEGAPLEDPRLGLYGFVVAGLMALGAVAGVIAWKVLAGKAAKQAAAPARMASETEWTIGRA